MMCYSTILYTNPETGRQIAWVGIRDSWKLPSSHVNSLVDRQSSQHAQYAGNVRGWMEKRLTERWLLRALSSLAELESEQLVQIMSY